MRRSEKYTAGLWTIPSTGLLREQDYWIPFLLYLFLVHHKRADLWSLFDVDNIVCRMISINCINNRLSSCFPFLLVFKLACTHAELGESDGK